MIDILIACLYADARKLQQLRNETQALGNTLEQHIYHVSRREVEARERESLLNRRNGQGFDGSNSAMYASQESASLQNSSQMVSELTMMSQSILGDLGDQRTRMKVGCCLIVHSLRNCLHHADENTNCVTVSIDALQSARTKALDIANRLGLSSSLLRVIERRDTVDFWIVIAGMIITVLFLYGCYVYSTRSS